MAATTAAIPPATTTAATPPPAQVNAAMLQQAQMQADTLFASAFRTNMIAQHTNQQLWDEHQLLSRRVQRRHPRHGAGAQSARLPSNRCHVH